MSLHTVRFCLPFLLLGATACIDQGSQAQSSEDESLLAPTSRPNTQRLFTSSNAVAGNQVLTFSAGNHGVLLRTISTGGTGTGAGLGSQGALALSKNGRVLLVVNAGSNDVTSFAVSSAGELAVRSRVASGGTQPISVAIRGELVYVLNAGGDANNVSGFHLDGHGVLSAIPGATYPLSAAAVGPAQVAFAPNGNTLVVTEKGTNLIDTFEVLTGGVLGALKTNPSVGQTPFGFAFTGAGIAIVSEAFGGAAGAGTVSSYTIDRASHGTRALSVVTGPIPDQQSAPCWIAVTGDDKFAYTTNTASGTISAYAVDAGALTLLDDGVSGDAGTDSGPTDMVLDRYSNNLFVLGSKSHRLVGFEVSYDGSLSPMQAGSLLPEAAAGLVAL